MKFDAFNRIKKTTDLWAFSQEWIIARIHKSLQPRHGGSNVLVIVVIYRQEWDWKSWSWESDDSGESGNANGSDDHDCGLNGIDGDGGDVKIYFFWRLKPHYYFSLHVTTICNYPTDCVPWQISKNTKSKSHLPIKNRRSWNTGICLRNFLSPAASSTTSPTQPGSISNRQISKGLDV